MLQISKRVISAIVIALVFNVLAWSAPQPASSQAVAATPVVWDTIDAGVYFTCAVSTNGGAWCWGSNYLGKLGNGSLENSTVPVQVFGLTSGVNAISTGGFHACVLTSAGGVWCWGQNNSFGQLGDGTFTNRSTPVDVIGLSSGVKSIATGHEHTCAVTADGSVMCWGRNYEYQLGNDQMLESNTPMLVGSLGGKAVQVTAGGNHTCALLESGGIKCWGDNDYGALGDGTFDTRFTPVSVVNLSSGVVAVTAGHSFTCALLTSGGVNCWGVNGFGQLGNGGWEHSPTPVDVTGLSSGVSQVDASFGHACALTSGGSVRCWGSNTTSEIGDGTVASWNTPVEVIGLSSGMTSVTAGSSHSCAVSTAGGIKCWGDNTYGQSGSGAGHQENLPVNVLNLPGPASALAAGANDSCALLPGGAVWCWGSNYYELLGTGPLALRTTATQVNGLASGAASLASGTHHKCVLDNGGVKCWGENFWGTLGDGTNTDQTSPVDVVGLSSGISALTANRTHTCALLVNGSIRCWGDNSSGQLGDGSLIPSSVPVTVTGLGGTAIAVSAGDQQTCAILSGGSVKCWGYNFYGQLGNGSTVSSLTPVSVMGLAGEAVQISSGEYHTCVRLAGGGIQCWGRNWEGQLGNGSNNNSSLPVNVSGISGVASQLALGANHSCAIVNNGMKCWGTNFAGQLGDGTTLDQTTAVGVSGLESGVNAISAGERHTCGQVNGVVTCWGDNYYGQLGNGHASFYVTPVDVVAVLEPEVSDKIVVFLPMLSK